MRTRSATIARRLCGAALGITLILMLTLSGSTPSALANTAQLFTTIKGTDVVSAGYGGLRGEASGSLTVSGIAGSVTRALLYWHGPTRSTNPTISATVSFAGQAVTGTNIGVSGDNCWNSATTPYLNSQAYRADVTSLVTGNGSYTLANFDKADAVTNGVSLIVFFDDGNAANNRDVIIFDGNDSNQVNGFDANGWNLSVPEISYSTGRVSLQLHVSDGQTGSSFIDGSVLINGQTLLPEGQTFSGDTVPNGPNAAATSGGLWDIRSFDVTRFLSPGNNALTLTSAYRADCNSLIAALIDMPASSLPSPTPSATPTTTATSTTTATPGPGTPTVTAVPTPGAAPQPGATPPPSEPAQLYIVQSPVANHGVAHESLVVYDVTIVNLGDGMAKYSLVTLPLNPLAVDVVDARFSSIGAWVTAVATDTLVFRTGPVGSQGGELQATIRLRVKADAADGAWLTDRALLRWGDQVNGGEARSNLPLLTVAAADDDRPTYALGVDPASGPVGSDVDFQSVIFTPYEPVGCWYNRPDSEAVTIRTSYADQDGGLKFAMHDISLAPGDYSMVCYGHWSRFTAVAPFTITARAP